MPVESAVRARVEAFASELVALIRSSAVDLVQEALGGGNAAASVRGRRPARAVSARHPKGAKRDPRVLEALTEKLAAFIARNPGQRIEQIGKALGVATKELALPVKKLIAAKRVSTKGQKRATTYYAGRGRPAKKRAVTRKAAKARPRTKKRAKRAPVKKPVAAAPSAPSTTPATE
jgi:hypothetical protein